MDDKNSHISTNRQRQKLLIAVFEAAHQGPSHGGPDRAVFSIERPPKSKKIPPRSRDAAPVGARVLWPPMYPDIYIYRYIHPLRQFRQSRPQRAAQLRPSLVVLLVEGQDAAAQVSTIVLDLGFLLYKYAHIYEYMHMRMRHQLADICTYMYI